MAFIIGRVCSLIGLVLCKHWGCVVFTVCEFKCLPFVRTNWFGRPLSNGKDIPNITNQLNKMVLIPSAM